MISKEKMDFAVNQVVNNCLKVKQGEKTMVITDLETKHIGLAIADLLKKVADNVTTFIIEDFGPRPEDGSNPLKLPEIIADTMNKSNVSVYAAQGKKGEFSSFRQPFLAIIAGNKGLRHAHMMGISDLMMEMGMASDYGKVKEVSAKVYNIVSHAKKIRVTTKLGTDFTAEFKGNYKWLNYDGQIKPGCWSNLPEGEVFTCPEDINGIIVVDGVIGDYFSTKYGLIEKTPVTIQIANGYAKEIGCFNKELQSDLDQVLKLEPNAGRVGEFAIGTNIGLTRLIGKLLQDEKFPGVHIAFGNPYPDETGATWKADSHIDMVIQKASVEVDGRQIMKEGEFIL